MVDNRRTQSWRAAIEDLERAEVLVPPQHEPQQPHRRGWKVARLALVAVATVLLSVALGRPSASSSD